MKKWLKYIGIVILLFVGFCFLPATPNENLVLKIKNLHIENSSFNFNKKYSILIDCNQPIFRKRLWVIENETKEIVCNSFVSQAKKSGWIWFNNSSNIPSSKISSVGLFKTLGTFESDYGKGDIN